MGFHVFVGANHVIEQKSCLLIYLQFSDYACSRYMLRNVKIGLKCPCKNALKFYNVYKASEHCSDITIGDFWGIKTVYPDMDDGKGVSAVLIRNEKGQALFNRLKNSVDYCSCRYEDIVKNNSGELYSVPFPEERNTFFSDMNRFDFEKLSNHYMEPSLKRKIKRFIKKFRGAM